MTTVTTVTTIATGTTSMTTAVIRIGIGTGIGADDLPMLGRRWLLPVTTNGRATARRADQAPISHPTSSRMPASSTTPPTSSAQTTAPPRGSSSRSSSGKLHPTSSGSLLCAPRRPPGAWSRTGSAPIRRRRQGAHGAVHDPHQCHTTNAADTDRTAPRSNRHRSQAGTGHCDRRSRRRAARRGGRHLPGSRASSSSPHRCSVTHHQQCHREIDPRVTSTRWKKGTSGGEYSPHLPRLPIPTCRRWIPLAVAQIEVATPLVARWVPLVVGWAGIGDAGIGDAWGCAGESG